MPIYKQTTELTKIADFFTATERDITEVYFGDKQVFTVWATYDGTLPAQYSANGSILADYRIYGAAGGVGDDSGTAYGYEVDMSVSDGTTSTTTPIYIGDTPLGEDEYVDYGEQKVYRRTENFIKEFIPGTYEATGYTQEYANRATTTRPIALEAGRYTIVNKLGGGSICIIKKIENDVSVQSIIVSTSSQAIIDVSAGDYVVQINKNPMSANDREYISANNMLVEGDTPPKSYIPYYQPTDPPVPLPALPTVDGVTITDYAGQSAAVPSRFVAKYRKEGY